MGNCLHQFATGRPNALSFLPQGGLLLSIFFYWTAVDHSATKPERIVMTDIAQKLKAFLGTIPPTAVVLLSVLLVSIALSSSAFNNMFKRLSSRFSAGKASNAEYNEVDGYGAKEKADHRQSPTTTSNGTISEQEDLNTERKGVTETFGAFAQLIHAAQRPLPTQTGDGSYIEHEEHSSTWADMRSLGFKDAKTLAEVMRSKTKGEYVADKMYLMERVIQVSCTLRAFPNHFKPDSIYAHYPMTIPGENRKIMKNLGRENHYRMIARHSFHRESTSSHTSAQRLCLTDRIPSKSHGARRQRS